MEALFEALSMPFLQRALVAGVLVAILAGYYGVFVVQRGLSFMGTGLAHAAFGGVALGILLGVEPLWTAAPFTIFAALGMAWVRERTEVSSDTAVGIIFAVSMALGIVFLALKGEYSSEAFGYLFGSILAVNRADIVLALAMLALSVLALPLWGRWAYATFDRELARVDRLPVARHDYLLSVFIAASVVVAVKVLGAVLIAAYLVIPAATARTVSRSFLTMTLLSVAFGVLCTLVGLVLSYVLDFPSGATIILLQAALFFALMPFSRLR